MRALSFGEALWDMIEGEAHLGGAPFNLAAHLAQLGCESHILSRVGDDQLGHRILQRARQLGVDTSMIQTDRTHTTGIVLVTLNGQGVPTFKIKEGVAYDFIELFAPSVDRLADGEFDVFCFGTLAQRAKASRSTLQRMLDACKSQHIFYDVNLREDCFTKDIIEQSLKYCTIAKMNDDEVGVLSNMFFGRVLPESDFAETLLQTFEIEVLCITKGSQGCGVHWDGRHESCPGVDVKVVDTVGSGDAFSAAFLYKYLGGADPVESATLANRIGAFVASKRGAIPLYSGEIRALVQCC